MTQPSIRPLSGVRIVDLTTVLFGPYASQWLADYGADVIKIEAPAGDSTRRTGLAREPGMAAGFMTSNRNKRSVVLDLKQAAGRQALLRLLDGADVFMHNIRPQKMQSLGLDSATLRTRFPRLVCASLNGFSSDGPYGGRPAYDDIIQGMCGMADLMYRQTGEMQYLPTVAADKISGLIGAQAILAAVVGRDRTGEGLTVEIPMFECMVNFTLLEHLGPHTFVPPQGETGYARIFARWRRPYSTLDGHVCIMPYTNAQWKRFFIEIGRPELEHDARFLDMASRTRHIEILYGMVAEHAALRSSQDWLDTCLKLDIPAGPVNTLDSLRDDPHLQSVGFFQEIPDADAHGSISLPGAGVRFNGQPLSLRAAPRLGRDTRQVLSEAGLTPTEIEDLLQSKAAIAAA